MTPYEYNHSWTPAENAAAAAKHYMAEARRLWPAESFPPCCVSFDVRGTKGGVARLLQWGIGLNYTLLKENAEHFCRVTVGHEVAHLVAWRIYQDRGHGRYWRRVMQLFGLEPKRCHSYDVTNSRVRTVRTVTYCCGCGPKELTLIRHKRVLQGRHYRCTACGQRLEQAQEA